MQHQLLKQQSLPQKGPGEPRAACRTGCTHRNESERIQPTQALSRIIHLCPHLHSQRGSDHGVQGEKLVNPAAAPWLSEKTTKPHANTNSESIDNEI